MNIKTDRVGILGSGSWATAIAKMLLENVSQVNWFFRKKDTIEQFKELGSNPRYLQSVEFDINRIKFYNNSNDLIKNSEIIVMAVPSAFLPDVLKRSKNYLSDRKSTRLNSSHVRISYAVFCLKKKIHLRVAHCLLLPDGPPNLGAHSRLMQRRRFLGWGAAEIIVVVAALFPVFWLLMLALTQP